MIAKQLKRMMINKEKIKYVFLTHTDFDHTASLSLYPNAFVYISEDEEKMINGTTRRNAIKKNSLPKRSVQDRLVLLKDGQRIEIEHHIITCIKAPGHTLGSMLYGLDDDYVFTGDACKVTSKGLSVHPYSMNTKLAVHTINTIIKPWLEQYKLMLTAHYGYFDTEKLV